MFSGNEQPGKSDSTATAAKWTLWLVLALLPLGLLSLFAYRTAAQSVRESIRVNNLAAAVVAADFVRNDFERAVGLTVSLAESETMVQAVRDRDAEAVRSRLRSASLLYPAIDRAFVHEVDGVLWSDFPVAPESLGQDFSDREWYAGVAREWEPYLSTVYLRHAFPQVLVVAIAAPVRQEGEVIGILVTQYRLESVSEGLSHVRWGEGGGVFLIDPGGYLAGHPEMDLERRLHREYAGLEPVQRAMRGVSYTGEFRDPVTDELTVATFYPLNITGRTWVLVASQPVAAAYAPLRRIAWNIGGAGGILAIAAVLVATALWRVSEKNRRLSLNLAERTVALKERTKRLQDLAAELTSAEQRERKRLAALLHDDLQQLLVAATMRLASALRRVREEPLKRVLEEVGEWIDRATASARDLTYELRPPALYEAGLAEALHWLVSHMWERHHLQVSIEREAAPEPMRDEVKALLFDCVRELLFNVAKHSGADRATVSLREEKEMFLVRVEDPGRGFEAGEAAREPPGRGFGLFSIRERLLALGGELRIDSRVGGGTRAELILPVAVALAVKPPPATTEALAAAGAPEKPAAAEGEAGTIRVLVVDDHALVRQGIANILNKDERIRVIGEAADGVEAISAVDEKHPTVVLMDLNMPRMNGIDATREIHRRWPETGVIGLSVQDDPTTAQSMLAAGADAFLSKGGDADRMIATIMEVTARSSRGQRLPPPP